MFWSQFPAGNLNEPGGRRIHQEGAFRDMIFL